MIHVTITTNIYASAILLTGFYNGKVNCYYKIIPGCVGRQTLNQGCVWIRICQCKHSIRKRPNIPGCVGKAPSKIVIDKRIVEYCLWRWRNCRYFRWCGCRCYFVRYRTRSISLAPQEKEEATDTQSEQQDNRAYYEEDVRARLRPGCLLIAFRFLSSRHTHINLSVPLTSLMCNLIPNTLRMQNRFSSVPYSAKESEVSQRVLRNMAKCRQMWTFIPRFF